MKPRVCALTDGSGHHACSRLGETAALLRDAGATAADIFGRFTDREMYAAILDRDTTLVESLVSELAEELTENRISLVVADAMEGFNPIHDLCRMIAGAACERAGGVAHYEYPIYGGPAAFDAVEDALIMDLDDRAFAKKLEKARELAQIIPDVYEMLERFGEAAFRRESFHRIADWTAYPWSEDERPLYEHIGEERVARHYYERVIRYADHMQPLLDHLRARVSPTACAF